jgi:hypothetical protein
MPRPSVTASPSSPTRRSGRPSSGRRTAPTFRKARTPAAVGRASETAPRHQPATAADCRSAMRKSSLGRDIPVPAAKQDLRATAAQSRDSPDPCISASIQARDAMRSTPRPVPPPQRLGAYSSSSADSSRIRPPRRLLGRSYVTATMSIERPRARQSGSAIRGEKALQTGGKSSATRFGPLHTNVHRVGSGSRVRAAALRPPSLGG